MDSPTKPAEPFDSRHEHAREDSYYKLSISVMNSSELVSSICEQNLAVYRASPTRLREDVGQEAEIAHDYRGRIVYELLQNADDAMAGNPGAMDKMLVRLTDTDLWVGNSGRPLDENDVRGLCGIGASSKGKSIGRKRASIGHKGMGFKSVLEISDSPAVMSETFSFALGRQLAETPVRELMDEIGEPAPTRLPAMRFPATLESVPSEWFEAQTAGYRTLFRFPLREDLNSTQHKKLAERLVELPMSAILFLKHLERIEVEVETSECSEIYGWTITRSTMESNGAWAKAPGISESGNYIVRVDADHADAQEFLVSHEDDLEIGGHRGGLDEYAWNGIEVSEVSVAALRTDGLAVPARPESRVLHVFLPTSEVCPYPVIINGAFAADLSRQKVRVTDDPDDYNGWLLRESARVLCTRLLPALRELGSNDENLLSLLDRGASEPCEEASTATGQALVEAMRSVLALVPLVPTSGSKRVPVASTVVPPLVDSSDAGSMFRDLLGENPSFLSRDFPPRELCSGRSALALADHGALALTAADAPALLAETANDTIAFEEHESGGLMVDPVLRVLERLWSGTATEERAEFESAVRSLALFPADGEVPGEITRVVVDERECFYPPRALSGAIPLEGLSFLSRELCWGALLPKERQEILHDQLAIWQALFGVREFKFPDVMRSSVLPALTLPDETGRTKEWESLQRLDVLAAVCQLSGRTPKPNAPLPYERLGTDRALFNLSRLPVPCRIDDSEDVKWLPAYQAYFGSNWLGESSLDHVVGAIRDVGQEPPDVPFLVGPELLIPLLDRYEHLRETAEELDSESEEVDIDEDDEQALDTGHRERWVSFLSWLGVNHTLRPVHFFDVEDRQTGWLTTKELKRPDGWAFKGLDDQLWSDFVESVRASPELARKEVGATPYFYELHDLEHLAQVLRAVSEDAECIAAKALLTHLSENWSRLRRYAKVELAVVPSNLAPAMRSKPQRAQDDEVIEAGDNLWLTRLRRRQFLPTTHGPKDSSVTWVRSRELDRRFTSRRGRIDAGQLLPILDVDDALAAKARPVLAVLGVRDEITSSSFAPGDARTILDRLSALYGGRSAEPKQGPDRSAVREVLRPTYRGLMELLPGSEKDPRFPDGVLAGSPLLEADGRGNFRFSPSDSVLWSERNGTRGRLGNPADLWTFVLDASLIAKLPLTRILGVRVLEDQLLWDPEPGEIPLDGAALSEFFGGVHELAPYILARLGAERSTESQQLRDASTLRHMLARLTPVEELRLGCRLDNNELASAGERRAFVDLGADGDDACAFVVWGENAWPPSAHEAEALASAFSEVFGSGHFEAFLALVNARDHAARTRLLEMAGASTDLEPFEIALRGDGEIEPEESHTEAELELPREPGEEIPEQPVLRPSPDENSVQPFAITPLYSIDELLIEGTPIVVNGKERSKSDERNREHRRAPREPGVGITTGYGGRTDLSALDALGMSVTMSYEINRLSADGLTSAQIFHPALRADQPEACVFDISSAPLIALAAEHSELFRIAIAELVKNGVSQHSPGCDVLTLRPSSELPIDRLIELKSSGQHAKTQAMTWNEWKTARKESLRSRFYLYLVGNLRSDLPGASPFIRTVRDPFGSIRAEESVDESATRKVVLRVAEFDEAAHLELGVANDRVAP